MDRLFGATQRKGQWNRALSYSKVVHRKSPAFCCAVAFSLMCLAVIGFRFVSNVVIRRDRSAILTSQPGVTRHLLSASANENTIYNYKCEIINSSTKSTVVWETCDFEKSTNSLAGWIVLYIFFTIVTFIAMAIVCDDFFVPSLETISEKLHLSEDVAGATFMAAGSSAPELFTSLAAVSFDSDAGIGTIAGSAVFNLLVIVSLSAALAKEILQLDWRPLARDSVWYLVSILYLIFVMYDSVVQIWDAVVLLVLYALYIVIMVLNSRLMDNLADAEKKCNCSCAKVEPSDIEEAASQSTGPEASAITQSTASIENHREPKEFKHDRRNSVLVVLHESKISLRGDTAKESSPGAASATAEGKTKREKDVSTHEVTFNHRQFFEPCAEQTANGGDGEIEADKDGEEAGGRIACCSCCSCCPDIRGAPPERGQDMTCGQWALYVLKWIVFVLAFPFICLFSWTIPECSREELKKYFMLSFFMSILWIAAISFCMVTVVSRLGCLLGVDTFVMSLVILAAGTSIPDLLSSIIVARDGFGDMAVSNAIGSNVFDIDLGLGLPFFIKLCVNKMEPIDVFSVKERRHYCQGTMRMIPHVKFGIILVILLVICIAVIGIAKFRLGKVIGISFFILYIGFLVYAFLQEFLCTYDC